MLAMTALVLLSVTACGRKESPQPPTLMVPIHAEDFQVIQRGEELIFSFAYPTTTPGGLPLPPIESVHLFEYTLPLAAFVFDGIGDDLVASEEGQIAAEETDSSAEADTGEEMGDETAAEGELPSTTEGSPEGETETMGEDTDQPLVTEDVPAAQASDVAPGEGEEGEDAGDEGAPPIFRPSGFTFPEEPEEAEEPVLGEDGEVIEAEESLLKETVILPRAEDQVEVDSREFGQLAEEKLVLEDAHDS